MSCLGKEPDVGCVSNGNENEQSFLWPQQFLYRGDGNRGGIGQRRIVGKRRASALSASLSLVMFSAACRRSAVSRAPSRSCEDRDTAANKLRSTARTCSARS